MSTTESYQLGLGPIEGLFDRLSSGEINLETATLLAASPEVSRSLSAEYVDALCRFSFHAAYDGRWESPLKLHAILLAAVATIPDSSDARQMKDQAEGDWVDIATIALGEMPDGRIYRSALAAGERTAERARAAGDQAVLANTLHRLGTLNLDPYSAGRSTSNYAQQIRWWQQRLPDALKRQLFFGDEKLAEMPAPAEALHLATRYYEQAVELLEGNEKGLSLKALVQAMFWLRIAGESISPDEVRVRAHQALELLDAAEQPQHVAELANILSALDEEAGSPDRAHSSVSATRVIDPATLPDLVNRHGPVVTMQLVNQTLALIEDTEPARGLELAIAARAVVAMTGSEQARIAQFQHELRLVRRTYVPNPVSIGAETDSATGAHMLMEAARRERWEPTRLAASLILLAQDSSPKNEEPLGIRILDEARGVAPALAQEHQEALLFLESTLWLGAGANAANGNEAALAIEQYGEALERFLRLDLWDVVVDCLRRIHDMASADDPSIGFAVVRALFPVAAALQLRQSAAVAELIQRICKRAVTAMGLAGIKPEVANALFQLAKGLLFDRALATGTSPDWQPDEQSAGLLREIADLEGKVPASDAIVTLGDPALEEAELLLTGYAGENPPSAGSEAADRLVNLRRRFDRTLVARLAAAGDGAPGFPLIEQLQAALDERSVLLNIYLGAFDGQAAVFAMLLTHDDIQMNVTGRGMPDALVELVVRGRGISMSPIAFEVKDIRAALLEDPGDEVVGAGTAEKLALLMRGYLGHLVEALQQLRTGGKDHLCVVPHGPLHYFPWHLLGDAGHPLADDWIVTALPTLGFVTAPKAAPTERRTVGISPIGVSFSSNNPYGLDTIPEAVTESNHIASVLEAKPIVDADATEESVLEALERSRMVHIATHGAHNVDAPSFQHLYLTPGKSSDGRLHAHEMLAANLRGLELVTLSACETALGRFDISDNPQGIPACLLLGGVSTIIGTLWPAETNASELFFTTLYGAIGRGTGTLDAFAAAQRATRKAFPAYRDWAAFYYIGRWS
jgi:hypothetical protein